MNSFYSEDELSQIGLKKIGSNVKVSRFARFYSTENIEIGSNVRIDDFCILSGNIILGNHIHISAYTVLYGQKGITLDDYSGLSPRCTIFSASDDFSGNYLIGPVHPIDKINMIGGPVSIGKYCQLGANCVVLPNITIHEGVVVGAMSLVTKTLQEWTIYAGIPAKKIKDRERGLLRLVGNI